MSAGRDQRRAIVALGILIALLTLALIGVLNRVWLHDQWVVWHYEPDPRVAEVVGSTGMTDHGRFLFYASSPRIAGAEEFNELCRSGDEHDAEVSILGCFTQMEIALYDVTDERLAGMIEATAAHELLHAVWYRLDDAERKRLEVLLEAQYQELEDDEELRETMRWYDLAEPGQHYNELHSIFGTEYAELDPELEAHYAQYFDDRSVIVGYYQQYQTVFAELIEERDALMRQLQSLADDHERRQSAYRTAVRRYEADVAAFNRRAEQPGAFASEAQFNRERAALVRREGELEAERRALNTMIERSRELESRLEQLSDSAGELYRSIDSYAE